MKIMKKNYTDFVFTPKALEIFKKIILSCVSDPLILSKMEPFFTMTKNVTLADARKFIQTATNTVFSYKMFNPETEISVEDVIMAFSGKPHWDSMTKLYDVRFRDIWIELFSPTDYKISHIVKPVCLCDNNGFVMKYCDERIPMNFFGVQNFSINDIRKIQLIHFGLVVHETEDNELIAKITDLQKELLQVTSVAKVSADIFYTDAKLSKIYERNISFYNSLKI